MVEQAINVYKKFYPDLLKADLPIDSLTEQLQNINLFTDHHKNELGACDAQYVLDHVIEPSLKSGNTEAFNVLLKVMEEHDNTDLTLLAKEMKIMYNSVPNDTVESVDGSPDPNPTADSSKEQTLSAADEVDGRVKDLLTSAASAVVSKFKKKHDHKDAVTTDHRVPSSNTVRDYGTIKYEPLIIKKYGPISRRSFPLGSPWLLAKGAGDKLFVRDYNTHQVVVFDNRLKYSHLIGNQGDFKSIGGIAVNDETQHVYVADQLSNCVKKFKLGGQFVTEIGRKGIACGEFRSPCGLHVSGTESLYVCDSNNHRIQVFHHDKFAYAFGQRGSDPGCFEKPEDLAMNSTENKLFISSVNRVQVFTVSGQFLKVFDHFGGASHKLVTPVGVCCTPDGHILISSYGTHCVHVLKEDGTYISAIKGSHKDKEWFVFPAGVIVRDNGNIVIASSGSHQLVVIN